MKRFLPLQTFQTALFVFLTVFVQNVYSQTLTPRYVATATNSNGFYEYLPQGYSSGSETYPLLIAVHGLGENGNGSTALPNVLNVGVPKVIKDGQFPVSFTVNGQTHKFIVIAPQFSAWPKPADIQSIITFATQNYRVNINRIYLTGLSMGGGITWEYAGNNATYAKTLAAIVPVCGASWPDMTRSKTMASANLPVWATHNSGDPTSPLTYTETYVANINAQNPNPLAKKTIFPVGGHDAWTTTYDPNFRENGLNVYEWMLQYQRGTAVPPPPANQAPVAIAGANSTITLPVNYVTLSANGSDADGTITGCTWSKIAGPTQFSISNPNSANPVISNLVAGTYTFRLTLTDNLGATGTSDVNITVNAAPTTNQSPVAYAGASITLTLPANSVVPTPAGYDSDGYLTKASWSKIAGPSQFTISDVNNPFPVISNLVAGTYTFRITLTDNLGATGTSDLNITVNAATGNQAPVVVAGSNITLTLPVNATYLAPGGYDPDGYLTKANWSKVAGPAQFTFSDPNNPFAAVGNLVAGTYTFRLTLTDNLGATGSSDLNITVNPLTGSSSTLKATTSEIPGNTLSIKPSVKVSPNPVVNSFVLSIDHAITGAMKVHIIDLSGSLKKELRFTKNQKAAQFNLSAGELPSGSYLLRVQIGDWIETQKFIKL